MINLYGVSIQIISPISLQSYRHPQAYKVLPTEGIPAIALSYLDCIVWGQCGETLKDKLQTLQNKAAQTIAKLRYDEANYGEPLTEFG